MALQAQIRQEPAKKGMGGLLGGLGALVGLGVTAATGGLAAPTTLGMLKAAGGAAMSGMGAGQSIGGFVSPGKAAQEKTGAPTENSPMLRRLQSGENKSKLEQLKQSAMAAAQLPEQERDQYMPQILKAAQYLKG